MVWWKLQHNDWISLLAHKEEVSEFTKSARWWNKTIEEKKKIRQMWLRCGPSFKNNTAYLPWNLPVISIHSPVLILWDLWWHVAVKPRAQTRCVGLFHRHVSQLQRSACLPSFLMVPMDSCRNPVERKKVKNLYACMRYTVALLRQ